MTVMGMKILPLELGEPMLGTRMRRWRRTLLPEAAEGGVEDVAGEEGGAEAGGEG